MKTIILLTLVVIAVFGRNIEPRSKQGFIVGGDDTDIADIPWQLSLQHSGVGHFCGASIITDEWAVTAAHCLDNLNVSYITVRAGSSYHATGGTVYSLAEHHIHPGYNVQVPLDLDVAVFRINGLFNGNFMEKITLADNRPADGSRLMVSGWGHTEFMGSSPDKLQSVSIPVVNSDVCNTVYGGLINENKICAGETGRSSCQTDSGGPLFGDNKLFGIVSYGIGCGDEGRPGVYVNVAATSARDFIKQYTGV